MGKISHVHMILASTTVSLLLSSKFLYAQSFDENMVKYPLVTKQGQGGQMQAFVVAETSTDYMATAKACYEHYKPKYKSAFCTVFANQADFDYAKIDKAHGGMDNLCYQVIYGVAIAGNVNEVQSNAQNLEYNKCPSTLPVKKVKVAKGGKGDSLELKEAKEVLKGIEEVLKRGLAMESLRNSNAKGAECGDAMRMNQPFAKDVRARAAKLGQFNNIQVAANTSMEQCVSCVDKGAEYCERLKKAIKEAKPVKEEDAKSAWDK